jgi:hypothetical protein
MSDETLMSMTLNAFLSCPNKQAGLASAKKIRKTKTKIILCKRHDEIHAVEFTRVAAF